MKVILLLNCVLLILVSLSACGSDAVSIDTTRTVTIDGVEKQVVKLVAINKNNEWLGRAITNFNKSSEKYHVEASYYMDQYVTDLAMVEMRHPQLVGRYNEFVLEAAAQFNIELASKSKAERPDIILVPSQMPTNSYITKGLFADLNEYMDNDPEFSRADYLPSLFEIFDRNGKMYEITPMFYLYGIFAKTADVGTEISWTLDEFTAYVESKPDAGYILASMTKREFIIKTVQYLFVNPVTGEVKFDRDDFKKILAVAERFPTEPYDYSDESDRYYEDSMWMDARHGDPIMLSFDISSFFSPSHYGYHFFGEEVTIKGWPSSTASGPLFMSKEYFSIMKNAENPFGAWEFLKYALNHPKANPLHYLNHFQLPVNLSALDEIAKFTADNEGNPDDPTSMQEHIDKYMTLFKSANAVKRENPMISRIIEEELGSYLSGQKSADEIIDIIENRIWVYLAEQN